MRTVKSLEREDCTTFMSHMRVEKNPRLNLDIIPARLGLRDHGPKSGLRPDLHKGPQKRRLMQGGHPDAWDEP